MAPVPVMRIAYVLYDRMTTLDFLGVFDALARLKTMGFRTDLEWDLCARSATVTDCYGLHILAPAVAQPLIGYDMVIVPGGPGSRKLAADLEFLSWLKTAEAAQWKVSVCTGSLLWGAAGYLRGKTATTHPGAYAELRPYCAAVSKARIVDEGTVITARGVTASLDLGLYLCEKLGGREAREKIRVQLDCYQMF